jgi:hypothetical protein
VSDLIEMGDVDRAWAEAEAAFPMTQRVGLPFYLWAADALTATRALLEGRLVECEALIARALATSQAVPGGGMQVYGAQIFALRWLQGRLAEIEPVFTAVAQQSANVTGFRPALAFMHCELGRHEEARRELESLNIDELPRDTSWVTGMTLLAQVAARVGDTSRVQKLYDLLLPYASRNVVVALAAACNGSCERYLGILASAMQRWEDAAGHFERAIDTNERMRARPFTTFARADYARMLMSRGGEGDRAQAEKLLMQAQDAADEMQMSYVAQDCRALLAAART